MGLWESMFGERARANPVRNYDQVQSVQRRISSNARSQSRARRKLEERIAALEVARRTNETKIEALETQLAASADSLDRLTRCLLQNSVIEEADLAAMLPKSSNQD